MNKILSVLHYIMQPFINILIVVLISIISLVVFNKYCNMCERYKAVENFAVNIDTSHVYPISAGTEIVLPEAKLDESTRERLNLIAEKTRDAANDHRLDQPIFNRANRPITRSVVSPDKLSTIAHYLNGTMNRFGNGVDAFNFTTINDGIKEDAEMDTQVNFDVNVVYNVKNNLTYANQQKVAKIILEVEVISRRSIMDDIFMHDKPDYSEMYINKLRFKDAGTGEYLPGGNIVDTLQQGSFNTMEDIVVKSDKEVNEIINRINAAHQAEINELGKKLSTMPDTKK
ncbi:MAG: hypothetical protein Faunusvirus37_4 [Faunusvirus sp.]|jgi:hypothetical protein|uniref:Uncharacterized protein n=1 Tax=Faunusvirus sp. TaxID=2487766 RepID=A0A3G4ZXP8_9VIRU|nr:MAG: hypothetical protein Faunusvirus37_4 [Faunusvirus sp.]